MDENIASIGHPSSVVGESPGCLGSSIVQVSNRKSKEGRCRAGSGNVKKAASRWERPGSGAEKNKTMPIIQGRKGKVKWKND